MCTGNSRPECDLTGRVTSHVSRGACKLSQPEREQVQVHLRASACVRDKRKRGGGWGEGVCVLGWIQIRCPEWDLTSFVVLIVICHLGARDKGYNHGYSYALGGKDASKQNRTLF